MKISIVCKGKVNISNVSYCVLLKIFSKQCIKAMLCFNLTLLFDGKYTSHPSDLQNVFRTPLASETTIKLCFVETPIMQKKVNVK